MLSLKSESGVFKLSQATWLMMLLVTWRTTSAWRRCQRQAATPEEAVWWKQHLLKSDICFQAEAWMYHIVIGNVPVSGLMQPNCRNWCPATTLGMFFWVWFDLWRLPRETVSKSCRLLEVILLITLNLSSLTSCILLFRCGYQFHLKWDVFFTTQNHVDQMLQNYKRINIVLMNQLRVYSIEWCPSVEEGFGLHHGPIKSSDFPKYRFWCVWSKNCQRHNWPWVLSL